MQNIKNKTKLQWCLEWFGTAIFLLVSISVFFLIKKYLIGTTQMLGGIIFIAAIFISGLMFILRTFGIFMLILFPEKKASDIRFNEKDIEIFFENGDYKKYIWDSIERIILSENFDGIYINSIDSKELYVLPMQYKVLESQLDEVISKNNLLFKKEKQWVDSNQERLDAHKNADSVKRDYSITNPLKRGGWIKDKYNVESVDGIEEIYYSKTSKNISV